MKKYSFSNDYAEGAYRNILDAIIKTNEIQESGYGEDSICKEAKNILKKKIKNMDADIHFVVGGTQANLISISAMLHPWESIISVDTGHIIANEAGAIESAGYKIIETKGHNGKIIIEEVEKALKINRGIHKTLPRVVFISNSTELGSVYKKEELKILSDFCKKNNLFLYLDGARIGSAITSDSNDLNLEEISNMVDIFYIGGTKNGALLGEAVIINNEKLKNNFKLNIKQKGALLAKGRILGIQFRELFKDDLFFDLAKYANIMASKIVNAIKKEGYNFYIEPVTNQIFPILPNNIIEEMSKYYDFNFYKEVDKNNSVIRLVTSWNTKEKNVDEFLNYFRDIVNMKLK